MLRGVEKQSACFVSASLALCCLAPKSRHETFADVCANLFLATFSAHADVSPGVRADLMSPV
jgi:hypothetical protein